MQPNWSQTLTGAPIGTLWRGSINLPLFETITSWMVSASRSSHPNLKRRDPKLSSQEHFKMVRSFTTVCERLNKPSNSTSGASHFQSLFYMTTCSKSRDYFQKIFWTLGKIDPPDLRNVKLNWNGLSML